MTAQGNARSVSEVYSVLNARYAGAANSSATQTALAMYGAVADNAGRKRRTRDGVWTRQLLRSTARAFFRNFPDLRNRDAGHGFRVGQRQHFVRHRSDLPLAVSGRRASQPVSPTVHELWGKSSSLTSDASSRCFIGAAIAVRAPQPLDLFSDRNGTCSG